MVSIAGRARDGFILNRPGIREFLKTEPGLFDMIGSMTGEVASQAREGFPDGFTILDGVRTTDRAQGNVTVANRSAEAYEGKHGVLAHAVIAAGFEPLRRR